LKAYLTQWAEYLSIAKEVAGLTPEQHIHLYAWNWRYLFVLGFSVFYVRSTARHAIHLQFDICANTLEIRAVQSPECIV
jgi:hypothetical protein